MGLFNILIADVNCSHFDEKYEARIQFAYGELRLYEYKIGDTLHWGSRYDVGQPKISCVKVYGIMESSPSICPHCRLPNEYLEFEIYVEIDVIKEILPMKSYDFDFEGTYKIL